MLCTKYFNTKASYIVVLHNIKQLLTIQSVPFSHNVIQLKNFKYNTLHIITFSDCLSNFNASLCKLICAYAS